MRIEDEGVCNLPGVVIVTLEVGIITGEAFKIEDGDEEARETVVEMGDCNLEIVGMVTEDGGVENTFFDLEIVETEAVVVGMVIGVFAAMVEIVMLGVGDGSR